MEWSVGHSTPAGKRGKTEIPQRSEEAQVPPPRKASDRSAMERTCSDKPKRLEQLLFVS
ncbi:hypothetical protein [Priestia flexa]|uniref:hypothetical protein n=1 Tax=Priestia flexa TaxID=86664 RepID=UPI00158917B5|nr:hypothetical protein [Priestia flexa]MBY6084958.1 hypothetical protein [Priestia flexa]